MFYSQDILQKKGGKFGIVWIAATRPSVLHRRDYSSVNVRRTCDDIIQYIVVQAPPRHPGGARPRFSLYLSAQLMYGVVKVYDRQSQILFSDAKSLSTRFGGIGLGKDIDLVGLPKNDLITIPAINDLEIPTGFGEFNQEKVREADAAEILDVEWLHMSQSDTSTITMQDIHIPASPKSPRMPFRPDLQSPMVVANDKISIREELPSSTEIKIPGEEDLPPMDKDIIPMEIMQHENEVPLKAVQDLISPAQRSISSEDSAAKRSEDSTAKRPKISEGISEPTLGELSVIGQGDITPAVQIELSEEPGAPAKTAPHTPDVTMMSPPARPRPRPQRLPLELSPISPSPRAIRRRKHHLLFADREVQISKKQMRDNMRDGLSTCQPVPLIQLQAAKRKLIEPSKLFSKPTLKELRHRKLLPLWSENAKTSHVPDVQTNYWTTSESGQSDQGVISADDVISADEQALRSPTEIELERRGDLTGVDISNVEQQRDLPPEEQSRQLGDSIHSLLSESKDASALSKDASGLSSKQSSEPKTKRRRTDSIDKSRPDLEAIQLELPSGDQIDELLPTVLEEQEIPIVSPPGRVAPIVSPHGLDAPIVSLEKHQVISSVADHQLLLRKLATLTVNEEWTTFHLMFPNVTTSRSEAARFFSALLDVCGKQKIYAVQEESYEDIFLTKGDEWTDENSDNSINSLA
ncbi:unnamed protein product [Owenia fusiformis]|uniref:Rad21/Rec8-like protein N-terminal domain-containing protein n=1 Tax=Owenia fusiformis TaxID=6347 RepID=A0A8S4NNV3_OWEFU|nr:unnamed protein product [Owenia fusiformis]